MPLAGRDSQCKTPGGGTLKGPRGGQGRRKVRNGGEAPEVLEGDVIKVTKDYMGTRMKEGRDA